MTRFEQIYEAMQERPELNATEFAQAIGRSTDNIASNLRYYGTNFDTLRKEIILKMKRQLMASQDVSPTSPEHSEAPK